VLEAVGSVPTNKYAEGYPGKRYYGGCEVVDEIEQTAIDRAKELFGAEHANVQPHAGAQTNMAVYFAACDPGDTILSLELAHGCTRIRCRTATSSPRRRTRPWRGRVPGSSSARKSTRPRSTAPSFRGCRAARSSTRSRRRRPAS